MSVRKLKADARVSEAPRACARSFSERSHASAVQAVCHINVALRVESECAVLNSCMDVYWCLLVYTCLHERPCLLTSVYPCEGT